MSHIVLTFLFCIISKNLFGYIDAGTGNYTTQILIAGIAVAAYTIFHFRKQILSFLKKK